MVYNPQNKGNQNTDTLSLFYLLFRMVGIVPLVAGVLLSLILSPELIVLFIALEAFNLMLNWYRGINTIHYYASFYALLLAGILFGKMIAIAYLITPVVKL